MSPRMVITLTAALLTMLPGVRARAAESYDNCTGFIDSVPATLTTQGTWCLRRDLATAVASGAAITIATNNVTIDCNGFKLGGLAAGDASQASGIHAELRQNATVRNCNVRGFLWGISLNGGGGHLVEDNRLDNNLSVGIRVLGSFVAANGNLVQRNLVLGTGGSTLAGVTIAIDANADVVENQIEGVFSSASNANVYGIDLGGTSDSARDNRIRTLTPSGTGIAYGIVGFTNATSAVGNHVTGGAFSTSGTGIAVRNCLGNVVSNFTTSYACTNASGNLPVP